MRPISSRSWQGLALALGCTLALSALLVAGQQSGAPKQATADIKSSDGKTVGRADLQGTPNGVLLRLKLTGAPHGVRAFHVHETGRCDAPSFESAGGHYNPTNTHHGFMNANGPHLGDMPNAHVTSAGGAEVEIMLSQLSLAGGPNSLLDGDGSALVIHGGADDYSSEPAGDAGSRFACGVIVAKP